MKILENNNYETIMIGYASEIIPIYKSIRRNSHNIGIIHDNNTEIKIKRLTAFEEICSIHLTEFPESDYITAILLAEKSTLCHIYEIFL